MSRALIPGTYDPLTLGHLDIIVRSAQLFDTVVVAVSHSQQKGSNGPLFSLEERVGFIKDATRHLDNVEVSPFSNLLVDFAVQSGAQTIVKGLRALTDFESEFQQASINYCLNPNIETVFVMSTPANMYLSSSMVKEVSQLGGRISDWVTPKVEEAMLTRSPRA
ncbi:MAG: pantetheine-phosphate adenylyltransferase [Coriobacteriales bacterium]|jgi:pantetheine-phosphate adenylyltransferase|nr:pantetheine-phosphate adenylyltransferase [Coriobacteriales bacterium]